MHKSARLFEIIQILRSTDKPVSAAYLAEQLEVSTRTIYRDTASLQAMRVPLDGEAGIGYIMRPGYDLPPLNFDIEELEAIIVGLGLLNRTGDTGLQKAANRIFTKIDGLYEHMDTLQVNKWGANSPNAVTLSELRQTIRDETKLRIEYVNEDEVHSSRTICPIATIYYTECVVIAAWCELREAFRHFRADRISQCRILEQNFKGEGATLRLKWEAQRQS